MIRATVVGPVWATKRVSGFPAGALLEVEEQVTGRRLIALDQLGSGSGDSVLVSMGSAVTRYLPGDPPVDALVVGVIDDTTPRASEASDAPHHDERN